MLRKSEDHLRFILWCLWCVSVLDDDDDDDEGRCQRGGDASDDIIRNILQQAKHQTMNDAPLQQEEEDYGTLEPSLQSSADFVQSIIQKVKCEINEDTEPSVSPSSVSRSFQTLAADPDQRAQGFKMETCQRPRSCPISSSCELQSLCLDTFSITQRVKETLTANNIGLCSPHLEHMMNRNQSLCSKQWFLRSSFTCWKHPTEHSEEEHEQHLQTRSIYCYC